MSKMYSFAQKKTLNDDFIILKLIIPLEEVSFHYLQVIANVLKMYNCLGVIEVKFMYAVNPSKFCEIPISF